MTTNALLRPTFLRPPSLSYLTETLTLPPTISLRHFSSSSSSFSLALSRCLLICWQKEMEKLGLFVVQQLICLIASSYGRARLDHFIAPTSLTSSGSISSLFLPSSSTSPLYQAHGLLLSPLKLGSLNFLDSGTALARARSAAIGLSAVAEVADLEGEGVALIAMAAALFATTLASVALATIGGIAPTEWAVVPPDVWAGRGI